MYITGDLATRHNCSLPRPERRRNGTKWCCGECGLVYVKGRISASDYGSLFTDDVWGIYGVRLFWPWERANQLGRFLTLAGTVLFGIWLGAAFMLASSSLMTAFFVSSVTAMVIGFLVRVLVYGARMTATFDYERAWEKEANHASST